MMMRFVFATCWTTHGRLVVWSRGRTDPTCKKDRILELALVRLIEIVGEAAARVSPEGCRKYSGVPWPQIIGMRNRLVHGYDQVDLDVLWDTIEHDLPPLVSELERILEPKAL
jgi:uncharacterized protein with HEPN domain